MELKSNLKAIIKVLPHSPGVYLFKDAAGQIIYIGKARDLRERCKSYIKPEDFDHKGQAIARDAVSLETIEVSTELAAMLLEAELISTHRPRLNVLLKQGQPFLYLLITDAKLPKFELVRTKAKKGTYFGPFIDKNSTRSLYEFLSKTFQIRLCTRKMESGCLNYHMGHCAGICKDDFDENAYRERIELVKTLLSRGTKALLEDIDAKILHHNELLEFEVSKQLVAYRAAVENFAQGKSSIIEANKKVALRAYKHVWVAVEQDLVVLQEHKLTFKELYTFSHIDEDQPLDEYVQAFYEQHAPAFEIIIQGELENAQLLAQFIRTIWKLDHDPSIIVNPTEHNLHVLNLARLKIEEKTGRQQFAGKEIKEFLGLPREPRIIDCFDISHTQGSAIVGASVRFVDGVPDKSACRRFIIQSLTNQNDYAALQEVAQRRYHSHDEYPDLLLIDGGKGQLSAVEAVLPSVECASIAKREERIFSQRLPRDGKRLIQTSRAGKTLISLRDYVHHFAITFERKKFSERARKE